jgi:hypothetical protein
MSAAEPNAPSLPGAGLQTDSGEHENARDVKTARILRAPETAREREGEQINAHAFGITLISAPSSGQSRSRGW